MIVLYILLGILGLFAGYLVLWTLICAVYDLGIDPKKEYTTESPLARCLVQWSAWNMLRLGRIRLHVSGIEKVPKENLVFVCNHRSNFDALCALWAFRQWKTSFISKESALKIPVFGRLSRKTCFMVIDREDPRKAMRTINNAAELMGDGIHSVFVYPEGTRSLDGGPMGTLHPGVFKIAQKAAKPVVICAIRGTEQAKKRWPLRPTHVYLSVLDVMDAETVRHTKVADIASHMKEIVDAELLKEGELS
ncbi:MAG: 1-acyl-sn-glycerol-3-phosphate acyltransferase [Firmicutes bacterium]|nr:1-acyl-sn-glycerol-3-phosphate acyltransferase [Bacillota bacterium]